ncbi:MAG: hypothetical protein RR840_07965 [Clostridium sp.]
MKRSTGNKYFIIKKLIKFEFFKIWNKTTVLSLISLIVLCSILNIIGYMYYSRLPIMTSEGKIIKGISAYKVLKSDTDTIKGTIDQKYLDKLTREYNSSKEKVFMNVENPKLETRDRVEFTKYTSVNYLINFAQFSGEVNSECFNLDFDFIKSEKEFYKEYKESVLNKIYKDNKEYGLVKYSSEEINKISKKVEKLGKFKIGYREGLNKIIVEYGKQYWLLLFVIALSLASVFAKDSNNGIEEIGLSSENGRKVNMDCRLIAGNLFSVIVYIVFWLVLLVEIGLVFSLSGWEVSIQANWYTALYNIDYKEAIFIIFVSGLIVTILISNIVMLISIIIKNVKIATLLSLVFIYGIVKLTETSNNLELQLNPIYYATRLATGNNLNAFEIYYFLGNIMVPYSLIGLVLIIFYFAVIRVLTVILYKRYRLN